MSDPIRLAKRVAAQLGCSRSAAERYVTAGRVRVDGQVVDKPEARVAQAQVVTVQDASPLARPQPVTVLLHKPAGATAAQALALLGARTRWPADAQDMPVPTARLRQLQPLLELPDAAEGLAVFSEDRSILRKLTQDAALVEQELLVDVAGTAPPGGIERMAAGLPWEGSRLPPAKVSWQSEARLRIAAKGIPPVLVPWMCGQVGLQVQRLRRLRIGRVPLAALPAGQWRRLPDGERF